ncbi:adipolin isoform X2 [Falco biarmicus]|uniref:Adipolin n=16 Tax=Neoaves TaxID=3078114 RepID=A0A8C4UUI3_FALTI|nr:adipolin isoform X2 [Falco peregrinus]XP_037237685.1 adipolin isoform X2 [Falco rusticolus]XP_040444507.1 adipolin isoform X2 [Falco naumanni]XP_055560398.1 adipolin isoform X2 [Falco cherrug]XP_056187040.1 adipolin isoform X2 [Falco biarmicus]
MKGCTWVFVATLLCQQFCLFRVTAAKRERKMKKEPNQYTEPFNATLSNSEELHGHPKILESPDPRITDPRRTWISFVHRPDDGNTSKRRCKGKDKKLRGLVGPPGPPGPQGPPGAPGAEVTREVLLQEFKEILKEAIERRASLAISAHPSQLPPLLLSLEEVSPHRRVEEAFHCKLKGQVIVDKKTLVELQNFQSPLAKGAFLRGTGLNLATGRFTAPVSGIYQFSANVHIDHSELKSKVQLRARDNVRVLICIESLCHRYTSLEVIAGLESNSKIFTIYVHGLLQLQAGQYTSIFVDNSAGAPITIQNGSDFMGMLMGA